MKKQVSVRLSDLEVEKLDVLAMGGSREGLFKIALRLMAERRVRLNELAIESFRQAQGSLIVLASAMLDRSSKLLTGVTLPSSAARRKTLTSSEPSLYPMPRSTSCVVFGKWTASRCGLSSTMR